GILAKPVSLNLSPRPGKKNPYGAVKRYFINGLIRFSKPSQRRYTKLQRKPVAGLYTGLNKKGNAPFSHSFYSGLARCIGPGGSCVYGFSV
ncbi:MAG: hypothetical protein ACYTBY_10670, partial [Planctomycetota bacterium]